MKASPNPAIRERGGIYCHAVPLAMLASPMPERSLTRTPAVEEATQNLLIARERWLGRRSETLKNGGKRSVQVRVDKPRVNIVFATHCWRVAECFGDGRE